jgi:hypothetical protein
MSGLYAILVSLRGGTLLCNLSTFSSGKLSGVKALVFKVTAPSLDFSSDAAQGMMHEV